jgi:V/A-type H+-transporting ATPase subunit A
MSLRGTIERINGSLVVARFEAEPRIGDLVGVGRLGLMGEIVRLSGEEAFIQCYESTSGLKPGEPVIDTGMPLVAELGPGIMGTILDGVERSETKLWELTGPFITRGARINPLDRSRNWSFEPTVKQGDRVTGGDILGTVQETESFQHRILLPPGLEGTVEQIERGDFTVEEPIGILRTSTGRVELGLMHAWPVRRPRPFKERLPLSIPLVTGQRVIDTFFPVAKGGTASIPGGFGTGKCVSPETPIILSDGRILEIGRVFDEHPSGQLMVDGEECVFLSKEPIGVVSLANPHMECTRSPLIYSGRSDRMVEVKTRSGRRAKVTPEHRLLVFSPSCEVKEIPADHLERGMFLVAPRRIKLEGKRIRLSPYRIFGDSSRAAGDNIRGQVLSCVERLKADRTLRELSSLMGVSYSALMNYYLGRTCPTLGFLKRLGDMAGVEIEVERVKTGSSSKPLKVPPSLDERLAEFLGLLLSDGMIKGERAVILFNNDDKILERFAYLAEELFGLKAVLGKERTVGHCAIYSTPLVRFLRWLGVPRVKKAGTFRVPDIISMSDDAILSAFLNGYMAGDCSFRDYTIEIGISSRMMWISLSYILSRLGILYRLYGEGGDYYKIYIEGKEEFQKLLSILPKEFEYSHIEKIRDYIERTKRSYNSKDIVPIDPSLLKQLINKLGIRRRDFEENGIFISNYIDLDERLSSSTFLRIADLMRKFCIKSDDEDVKRLLKISEMLQDVYLDEVVEVKDMSYGGRVYDLTIPEYQNFVGGEGPLFLHNTVMLQQISKWADADVIILIGCGERGNEMADVVAHFPELTDPRSGRRLIERTVIVANVSNMPVSAREASVYLGITLGEYYRDMGYDVAVMADSTSRWAEALRDISGRLEEIPAESGYPAYLSDRIAEIYERAGRVVTLGSGQRVGSLTLLGAVSPPGGDFSEPVTTHTLRYVGTFWALDQELAFRRHFPAINWLRSFSKYLEVASQWWSKYERNWDQIRAVALGLLEEAAEIEETARIIGEKALPDEQRLVLLVAEMLREGFLVQSAFHEVDKFCEPEKQAALLKSIVDFYNLAEPLIRHGIPIEKVRELDIVPELMRLKEREGIKPIEEARVEMKRQIDGLAKEYEVAP